MTEELSAPTPEPNKVKLQDHYAQGPSGILVLDVFRRGHLVDREELIERFEAPNLIVDGAKQVHARLLGGDVANRSVASFGVGTSGAAAALGNTSLTGAFTKAIDVVSYPASNQVRFAFSLGTGDANGMPIMEFGLFTAGGTLYARRVRSSALNKESDITVSGTWTISF